MMKTKWRSKLENAMETGLMRGLHRAYMLGLAVPKMGDVFIVFNSHMAVASRCCQIRKRGFFG